MGHVDYVLTRLASSVFAAVMMVFQASPCLIRRKHQGICRGIPGRDRGWQGQLLLHIDNGVFPAEGFNPLAGRCLPSFITHATGLGAKELENGGAEFFDRRQHRIGDQKPG